MPRNSKRKLAVSVLLTALFTSCPPHASASPSVRGSASQPRQAAVNRKTERGRALWPGSRFTEEDRARAVRRGLRFIYRTALNRENFESYGSDYLWCFYTISEGVSDAGVRRLARRMGLERARVWRRSHRAVPAGVSADELIDFAFGSDAADSLGLRDDALKVQIRSAAARFTATDLLLFDPTREPPPSDVPEVCEFDKAVNERGAKVCRRCGRPLRMRTRYDVWYGALITVYTGDHYGVRLGATYGDVLKWLTVLRPYRGSEGGANAEFYDTVYALTHVVYTLNDYGQMRLPARLLPEEFAFLKSNLREAVREGDADMLGEFMDSLRALGLSDADAEIRAGTDYLLAHQNADGSWGDAREGDIYLRYHPTWGGVAALSDYAWRATGPSPAKLRLLLALGSDGAARKD
ncbi:MAG: hypothetical protein M3444_20545 [Acidobacteriota bacterium]|nr:hypothetical protein [Acidobacteriota bacterium]MDQ5835466.1 hypothetical protein [Acidobacteriota bacterium]